MKIRLFLSQPALFTLFGLFLLCASDLQAASAPAVQLSSLDAASLQALITALVPSKDAFMQTIEAQKADIAKKEATIANLAAQQNKNQGTWAGSFLKMATGLLFVAGASKVYESVITASRREENAKIRAANLLAQTEDIRARQQERSSSEIAFAHQFRQDYLIQHPQVATKLTSSSTKNAAEKEIWEATDKAIAEIRGRQELVLKKELEAGALETILGGTTKVIDQGLGLIAKGARTGLVWSTSQALWFSGLVGGGTQKNPAQTTPSGT